MTATRREFAKKFGAALAGVGLFPTAAIAGGDNADANSRSVAANELNTRQTTRITQTDLRATPRLFTNPLFEFTFQIGLGRAYHCAGNPGKILYIAGQTEDGNYDSAFAAFKDAGDEARAQAEASLEKKHTVSAREAYMWAQNYYNCATYFADGSKDPSQFEPTWELHYDCWLKSLALFEPAGEAVSIPYEKTELHGFLFKAGSDAKKRPLLIMNNGSDGSLLDMYTLGGAAALKRGYNVLIFDGPGQGFALWKQKLYFRWDWEKVLTPVVDFAVKRADVDARRIAAIGVSQGGYWVPRACAFERRITAMVADPGVVDVSTAWVDKLPDEMKLLLKNDQKDEFDAVMAKMADSPMGATLRFRMRPYGFASPFDTFKAVQNYHLRDLAREIHCATLITSPENETFWPGQSQEMTELLNTTRMLVPFTVTDGADLHCEPKAVGLRDARIFDWLDETLDAALVAPRPIRTVRRTKRRQS